MEVMSSFVGLVNRFVILFPKLVDSVVCRRNDLVIHLRDLRSVVIFLECIKKDTFFRYAQLLDLFVVDYPDRNERFELSYMFLSPLRNNRIIVRVVLTELDMIESVVSLYKSAGWMEREAWDMYGVFFSNHLDLRRILTDYGFEGFPLRKDFPLSGYLEARYDEGLKKIVLEALEVSQEYRFFEFANAWRKLN